MKNFISTLVKRWQSLVNWQQYLLFYFLILIFRLFYSFYANNFGQDIARDLVLMANKLASGDWLIGYGPKASVGNFYLAPLYYQLHLLLSALTHNYAFVMKLFVVVVESATPLVLYQILCLIQPKKQALALALLYTLSPLVTIFASFAWNPNTIPFLVTLALWAMLRIVSGKFQGWEPLTAVLAITVALHFHYQAVVLLPFLLIVFVFSWRTQPALHKKWLLGLLFAFVTILPYLLAEQFNGWQNTLAIQRYFTQEHSRYFDRVSKPDFVFKFIPGFFERVLINQQTPANLLGLLIVGVGFWQLVTLAWQNRKQPAHRWLLLYLLLILIMLRIYKGDKVDYYMSTLYLAPVVLLAYIWQAVRWLGFAIILVVLFFAGHFYGRLERVDRHQELVQSVEFITQTLADRPARFVFYNNDDINTFVYGLQKYGQLNIDQSALLVVDICESGMACAWNGVAECNVSRGYTYAAILKKNSGYTSLATQTIGQRGILIGTLQQQPTDWHYSLYTDDLSYGSDLLYQELFETHLE
jgi:4-amino-4-deoxy-L-arabinose transferase-like glycosyltransferase